MRRQMRPQQKQTARRLLQRVRRCEGAAAICGAATGGGPRVAPASDAAMPLAAAVPSHQSPLPLQPRTPLKMHHPVLLPCAPLFASGRCAGARQAPAPLYPPSGPLCAPAKLHTFNTTCVLKRNLNLFAPPATCQPGAALLSTHARARLVPPVTHIPTDRLMPAPARGKLPAPAPRKRAPRAPAPQWRCPDNKPNADWGARGPQPSRPACGAPSPTACGPFPGAPAAAVFPQRVPSTHECSAAASAKARLPLRHALAVG
jgi:hypothetical protein